MKLSLLPWKQRAELCLIQKLNSLLIKSYNVRCFMPNRLATLAEILNKGRRGSRLAGEPA